MKFQDHRCRKCGGWLNEDRGCDACDDITKNDVIECQKCLSIPCACKLVPHIKDALAAVSNAEVRQAAGRKEKD